MIHRYVLESLVNALREAGNPATRIITSDLGFDRVVSQYPEADISDDSTALRHEFLGIKVENLDLSPFAVVTIQAVDGSRITLKDAR